MSCPFTETYLVHPSVLPRVASFVSQWAQHQGGQPVRLRAGVKESSLGPPGRVSSISLGHVTHYPALGGLPQ